jgi:hypothetical protein
MTREYTPRRSVRKNQPTVEIRRLQCAGQLEEIARLHKISRTTVAHVKNLLSGVFRHAAQQGYFDAANPVKLAVITENLVCTRPALPEWLMEATLR